MLSSFPTMLCSDKFFETPSPAFEGGFTPWDFQESPFCFQQDEPVFDLNPTQEPVFSNSGSDNSNPIIPFSSNSCSNDENRNSSTSGSDGPPTVDERKRRRMISNRQSARRSRMRKQKQLENLRNQVNRFKVVNWEMMNQLRLVTHQSHIIVKDNERLQCELVMLRQKLWERHQDLLLVQQLQQPLASSAWPCNNVTSINEQQTTTTLMT